MADAARRRGWGRSLAAFALGCLLTGGTAAGLWLYLAGRGQSGDPGAAAPAWPRPEFTRLVMGKPEAEVLAAVGPPDSTSQDDQAKYWHYKYRTRDPVTDAADSDVQVVVEGGKVVAVNY